jgi:hypothetical protein
MVDLFSLKCINPYIPVGVTVHTDIVELWPVGEMTRLCYYTVIASNGCFMQQNKGLLEHCVCSTGDGPLGDLTLIEDL